MSPKRRPQSDPLWDDLPQPEPAPRAPAPAPSQEPERATEPDRAVEPGKPPDWALPAWDSVPEDRPSPKPAAPGRSIEESARVELHIFGVTEITRSIRDAVRAQSELRDLWVEGEVGRVTVSSAGHAYFTLKDDRSQLACVFFRDDRVGSPFEPRTGLRVVVHGRVDVFEAQGVYQLYVSSIQPAGFGDLALQFEALKARLAAEGLFDSGRKRPLPVRPAVVGVVTSASGAVWHDIQHVVRRRWPLTCLVLAPCQVQGDGAAQSVVTALNRMARWGEKCRAEGRPQDAPAVVILARGGGSLEDLWSFNDERVVRAVVAHPVPVVSGVGHEVDVTLADFAADVRAPTPSAAAELVVPERGEMVSLLRDLSRQSASCAARAIATARNGAAAEGRALERLRPAAQLAQARERAGYMLDRATNALRRQLSGRADAQRRFAVRLTPAVASALGARRVALERSGAALAALGPQATLDRGYAIVRRRTDGSIVRDPSQAPAGEGLTIRLARGEVPATADARDELDERDPSR